MAAKTWKSAVSNVAFWAAQGYLCSREPVAWLAGMTALYWAGGLKISFGRKENGKGAAACRTKANSPDEFGN